MTPPSIPSEEPSPSIFTGPAFASALTLPEIEATTLMSSLPSLTSVGIAPRLASSASSSALMPGRSPSAACSWISIPCVRARSRSRCSTSVAFILSATFSLVPSLSVNSCSHAWWTSPAIDPGISSVSR